jgi:hypothetical protein
MARHSDEDDDDADDRPRKRKRKKQKKSSGSAMGLIIGGAVFGVLVLVGIVVAVLLLRAKGTSRNSRAMATTALQARSPHRQRRHDSVKPNRP